VRCNPFNLKNLYMLSKACAEPVLGGILAMGTAKDNGGNG